MADRDRDQRRHHVADVDRLTARHGREVLGQDLRPLDQHWEIGQRRAIIQRRIDQPAVPPPQRAVIDQHAGAEARRHRPPHQRMTPVVLEIVDQHPANAVRIVDHEDPVP